MTTRARARRAEEERNTARLRLGEVTRQLEQAREQARITATDRYKVMAETLEELGRLRRTIAVLVHERGGTARLGPMYDYVALPKGTHVEAVGNVDGGLTLRLVPPN